MKSLPGGPDAAALERVVLSNLDDAYTVACYLVRDEHDAQDVVQDAALRAWRHFESFRGGDARSWLLSIVRNCSYTWIESKRGKRIAEESEQLLTLGPAERGADELAIRGSEQARIEAALARLPLELREVVVLREIAGLSYKEISDVVGVPAGTVMSRLS